jgi:hypothetical protein
MKTKDPFNEDSKYLDSLIERCTENAINQGVKTIKLRRRIILLAAASVLLFVSLFWFYNDNQHAEPQDFAGNKETQVEDFLNSLSNDEVFTIGYYEVEEIDEY